uniref:Norsolorinic acid reductase B-like n=1 Tax=Saccoglossus kowalevskii TaxID=10224 RepID=A0ABM0GPX7_SACKO|nr:PREDICTED: norsolorinic acid reductase B-like [Saccoglossus kowalevskii]
MMYNYLGNSGLRVSEIGLGTMKFGEAKDGHYPGNTTEEMSHTLMDRFVDLGGNFIDTADVYQAGLAEQHVGSWLHKRQNRENMVIASKVRFNMDGGNANGSGLSRKHIIWNVEESLKRLQTDYIDLYQIHCWDKATPLQETLRTLDDLVKCGKVRYIGASNVKGWQLQQIVCESRYMGLNPWIGLQAQYSLLCRGIELELVDVCKNEGLGIIPWSPLKGGWLSGKIHRDVQPPEGSRIAYVEGDRAKRENSCHFSYTKFSENEQVWKLLEIMRTIATKHGKSVAQVAIRWLLQKDTVPSVIIGVKTLQQLNDNMGAVGWSLTDDEVEELENASKIEDMPHPYELNVMDRIRTNLCK